MAKKRLLSNFSYLSVLQLVNYILPFLLVPYLVRVLGTETFGLLAFATGVSTFFLILTDFGFNLSATREISVNRNDKDKIEEIYSAVTVIKLALALFSLVILLGLVYATERFSAEPHLYLVSFGLVIGSCLFPVWFFQGIEQMRGATLLQVASKVAVTISTFFVVNEQHDYILVPLLASMGAILGGVGAMLLVKLNYGLRFRSVPKAALVIYFKGSADFFVSRASVALYTASNTVFLGLLTSNNVVGMYSMAEKLYAALQAVYQPLVTALYPYICSQRNVALFRRILRFATILNSLAIAILFVFAEDILRLVYGAEQATEEIITVLRIFAVTALMVVPSIMLGYPFLGAMGYAGRANRSVMYGAALHFAILTVAVMFFEISPLLVASSVFVTEAFVFVYRLIWSKRIGL